MASITIDKNFDLYSHMKINIKCTSPFCEIHDSAFTDYCLGCKRPVCEICKNNFHSTHQTQEINKINFDNQDCVKMLDSLESSIKNFSLFNDPNQFKKQILSKIENEFNDIEKLLNEVKKCKLEEIESIFNTIDFSYATDSISETKSMYHAYTNKYKNFYYNEDVKDDDKIIFLQTYDLINSITVSCMEYENVIKEVKSFFNNIESTDKTQFKSVKDLLNQLKEEEINNAFKSRKDLMLIDNSHLKNMNQNSQISQNSRKSSQTSMPVKGYNLLNCIDTIKDDLFKSSKERIKKSSELIENFKRITFESLKKHGSLIDIEKNVKIFDEKINKRSNFIKGKANLKFSPSQAKAYSLNGVLPSNINLSEISEKTDKTDKTIEKNEKDKVKDKINKVSTKEKNEKNERKSQIDILDALEEGDEDIDSDHYENNNMDNDINDEVGSSNNKKSAKNRNDFSEDNENNIYGDDEEIILENGFAKESSKKKDRYGKKLHKMFLPIKKDKRIVKSSTILKISNNENTQEFNKINKLHEIIKENQRVNSMIKKQDDISLVIGIIRRYYTYIILEFVRKNFINFNINKNVISSNLILEKRYRKDDLSDNVKLLEGTNEIQIFCREKRKLMKKTLPFNKSIHGTTILPIGCRSYIARDKLYISGGKDSKNMDIKLFLMYCFRENKIVRLPDMKKARSYHTMTFHENLKSMLVFGGENNKTCESFDFMLGTWNELPELNTARANIKLYIDKLGTFAYAFCGSIGLITQPQFSYSIELLDLVDINQGWAKIDYNNKALVDLKFSHNGIYPLTEDKVLIYGAKESRKIHKVFVIFDLRTFDVLNVDDSQLEDLRIQAAKNPELSKILM